MCLLRVAVGRYPVGMYKDINPFGLRLTAELKDKVAKSAEENHRSMNAELVAVINEHYREGQLKEFSDGELVDELIRRWGRDRVSIRLGDPEK